MGLELIIKSYLKKFIYMHIHIAAICLVSLNNPVIFSNSYDDFQTKIYQAEQGSRTKTIVDIFEANSIGFR